MQSQRAEPADRGAKTQIREYKESLIIEAASKLFYERGFQRTTLDDIAAVLGVTKPFIYTYFKSKYSILERLFDKEYGELYDAVIEYQKLPEQDVVRRFEYFVGTYIRKNFERRNYTALMLEEEKNLSEEKIQDMRRKQHEFDRLLAGLVAAGVRAGVFHVNDTAIASLAISGVVRWLHRWYSPSGRMTADQLCAELTQAALRIAGYSGDGAAGAAAVGTAASDAAVDATAASGGRSPTASRSRGRSAKANAQGAGRRSGTRVR